MSFMELMLIILVALVVIKPERLPEVAKHLGIWFKWFNQASAKLKNELSSASEKIIAKNDNP